MVCMECLGRLQFDLWQWLANTQAHLHQPSSTCRWSCMFRNKFPVPIFQRETMSRLKRHLTAVISTTVSKSFSLATYKQQTVLACTFFPILDYVTLLQRTICLKYRVMNEKKFFLTTSRRLKWENKTCFLNAPTEKCIKTKNDTSKQRIVYKCSRHIT